MSRIPRELRTARLVLRAPREDDLGQLVRIYGDEKVVACVGERPYPPEVCHRILQSWLDLWHRDGFGYFCVAEERSPRHCIGFAGVASTDQMGELNLFYWFSSQVWGKGFAREACDESLDLAFNRLGASSVVARTPASNVRSRNLAKALGMKEVFEGAAVASSFIMLNTWYLRPA